MERSDIAAVKLIEFIRAHKRYRGQIRSLLEVGAAKPGPVIGEGVSVSEIESQSARLFLQSLDCEKLSGGQADGMTAMWAEGSTVMLSGPSGSGLTLAGLTAAVVLASDGVMDVLCVAPCGQTLKRWKDDYGEALARVSDEHGFLEPTFCEELPSFDREYRTPACRMVFTSMEAFQARLEQSPDLAWLNGYGSVLIDSIDALLVPAGVRSTTAIANAISAARMFNPDLRIGLTCFRFEDNARFAADLVGVQSVDVFECESREGQKTFLLWSSPLDREKFGGAIVPGSFFDDLVDLCTILARSGRDILLYDPASVFCRSERDHLVQQVADHAHAPSVEFCDNVTGFLYPDRGPGSTGVVDNGPMDPVRVCLGLKMPIGVLRDRLRAVSSPEALVVIVETRTPAAGLHRYAMTRQQAGLSIGLPPECRFLENALHVGIHKALCCVDSADAFRDRKRYLDAYHARPLTKADMGWARYAWSDLLSGRLDDSMKSIRLEAWSPLDVSIETAAGITDSGANETGLIPTDYYPGALVVSGDRRHQVIRAGPDLRRPWRNAEMQPAADLDRETVRVFTVSLTPSAASSSLSQNLHNTLFPGITYGCRTVSIQETVTGFETISRFSSDIHLIGGNISPVQYPGWRSRVLLVKPDDSLCMGANTMATLCALLPDAIALKLVMPKHALTCIMLDADGQMCSEPGQHPVVIALYARDPMDHVTMDVLGTAGLLQDVFRMALSLLLACPCADGCPCCIPIIRLPKPWRERIDKDRATRDLGQLLGCREAEQVAEDRHQMRDLERVVDRVRDVVVPHQFRNQLGLELRTPVTLRHLVGRLASQHGRELGVFTGNAVYVRPDLSESTYIGLVAHEYTHQWQRDFLDQELEQANPDNIEDPDNVLFPAFDPGTWRCRGALYIEGSAQWVMFRVADAYNLKPAMMDAKDAFRGNEYGEGFQHLLWLERKHGTHGMLEMLRKDKPECSVYAQFSDHPNPKTALYEASLLYAALSDSALNLIENGGLACCESRGDWPFYTRVSHYRSQYREIGGDSLPSLEMVGGGAGTGKGKQQASRRKTSAELVAELLDVSVGACLNGVPDVAEILEETGLHCATCACSRSDRPCSLRSAAYMHSSQERPATGIGEELAKKIGVSMLSEFSPPEDTDKNLKAG